ncbi:hypothetical protein BY458DRAFT_520102 [Sporodiniella umbellata]|nr:hypothetical protein BY458DRAFT_520102 [Sporodiniella umbellata]
MADCKFKKTDFSFIQDFHQIIELVLNGSNQDGIGKAVTQLEDRIMFAKQVLEELPGLHYTKEEQERLYQQELDLLQDKKQQLDTYLNLPPFQPSLKQE